MHINAYQDQAVDTAIYPTSARLTYPALGLTGEAGEVADKVKKIIRDGTELTPELRLEIAKEVGDVLWYIAAISRDLGYDMQSIAMMNIQKLNSRKARGVLQGSGDNR